jgi:ketosteroid isomerase-like protein
MSRENVETVRQLFEAFNRRDTDALLELLHPHVEWLPMLAKLEGAVYRGRDEVARWVAELDREWAEFRPHLQECRDLGDVVLALGTGGRGSGVDVEAPFFGVLTVRGGKLAALRTFTTEAEALEAVGLRE